MLSKLLLTGVMAASIGTGSVALASNHQSSTNQSSSSIKTSVANHGPKYGTFKNQEFNFGLFKEVATILGMDQKTLLSDLKSGQSLAEIASSKKMDQATLVSKLIAAEKTELDKAVSSGKITAAQETQRLAKATTLLEKLVTEKGLLQKNFKHKGDGFGPLKEVSSILSINQKTLLSDLKSGQSLADIASSKKMDQATLVSKLVAAEKTELDKAVKSGKITAAQETQRLAKATTRLKKLVTEKGLLQKNFKHKGDGFGPLKEVSSILSINQKMLLSDLKSGQSLAEIASNKKMDQATLVSKLVAAEKTKLDKAVSSGNITAAQETQRLAKVTTQLKKLVTQKGLPEAYFNHGKDRKTSGENDSTSNQPANSNSYQNKSL
jgi:D-Tyr-tRNAtyr deacylase